MRILVGLLGFVGLAVAMWGFTFVAMMAHGFGVSGSHDLALLLGALFAVIYFAGGMFTAMPWFPPSALLRAGVFLHLVLLPLSILLLCFSLGAKLAGCLIPGGIFACLWFFMARHIAEDLL